MVAEWVLGLLRVPGLAPGCEALLGKGPVDRRQSLAQGGRVAAGSSTRPGA